MRKAATILAAACISLTVCAQNTIEFRHPLPALHADGRDCGSYNNEEMGVPAVLTTLDTELGEMMHQLRNSIFDDRRIVVVDGRMLMCSKNWIRDHVHEMKAFRHWEYDLESFLDFIIATQKPDGCYYELIKQLDDYHWQYVSPSDRVIYEDDNLALVRLEIESDIEYLVVEGATELYKVTGDDKWLRKVLPSLEKGIDYATSDPKRWDAERGLVKRAYTIDTWDFTYMPDAGTNRRIDPSTPMAIMHGDNSGVWQAMMQLSWLNRRLGREGRARAWEQRAKELKANTFKYLWNGRYFIHELPLNVPARDDKEAVRLSLSNTYDINRGFTDTEQSRSIIEEYIARRDTSSAFAEWFSIDPPYEPSFFTHKSGRYVNGAISPFTAGELAKAAFNNGYEAYGWDIIRRFEQMMKRDGDIYFLYSPKDGTPQGGGPSAWGAAALLSAIDEGLAGVTDQGVGYDVMGFSPRFPVTQYDELRYFTGYEKSHKLVDIRYILTDDGMRYLVKSPARTINAHILLPEGKDCARLTVDGKDMPFTISTVGSSRYVDAVLRSAAATDINLFFK